MTTSTLKQSSPADFSALVTYVVEFFNLSGGIPSHDRALEHGIPDALYTRAFKDKEFRQALTERGINLAKHDDPSDWRSKGLTEIQLIAANQLLDLVDTRTRKKKLQDLGLSTSTYNAWLKDDAFRNYIQARAEQAYGENKQDIQLALMEKVNQGDLKAIMYLNEMMGVFTPQRAGVNTIDVNGLVVKIIEIIDDEIPDGELKLRIGDRLRRLIAINNAAHQLTDSYNSNTTAPVGTLVDPAPEVVPIRSIDLSKSEGGLL